MARITIYIRNRAIVMPGQFHKRQWFFGSMNTDGFRWVGARFYGIVWGYKRPLVAVAIDDSWYDGSTSYSLVLLFLEVGFFSERLPTTANPEVKP